MGWFMPSLSSWRPFLNIHVRFTEEEVYFYGSTYRHSTNALSQFQFVSALREYGSASAALSTIGMLTHDFPLRWRDFPSRSRRSTTPLSARTG
jgi:hypothetical protein